MQRMQTKVYRYVCALASTHLYEGIALNPEVIEMIYWFPENPESLVRLPYNKVQFEADHHALNQTINEIKDLPESKFRMTTDTRRCSYCRYRTYCGTSDQAGKIENYVDESVENIEDEFIDFEQIAEIEF